MCVHVYMYVYICTHAYPPTYKLLSTGHSEISKCNHSLILRKMTKKDLLHSVGHLVQIDKPSSLLNQIPAKCGVRRHIANMHACKHTTHAQMQTWIYAYKYECIYLCIHAGTRAYIRLIGLCIYVYMHMHMYIQRDTPPEVARAIVTL